MKNLNDLSLTDSSAVHYTSLEESLLKLEPLEISQNIYKGHGIEKLQEAENAWNTLGRTMGKLSNEYDKTLSKLQTHWSGSAKEATVAAFVSYKEWIDEVICAIRITCDIACKIENYYTELTDQDPTIVDKKLDKIRKTYYNYSHNIAENSIEREYEIAFSIIVPPQMIIENRQEIDVLKENNLYARKAERITELNTEYEEWRVRNIQVMMRYARDVTKETTKLLKFPKPPTPELMRSSSFLVS